MVDGLIQKAKTCDNDSKKLADSLDDAGKKLSEDQLLRIPLNSVQAGGSSLQPVLLSRGWMGAEMLRGGTQQSNSTIFFSQNVRKIFSVGIGDKDAASALLSAPVKGRRKNPRGLCPPSKEDEKI